MAERLTQQQIFVGVYRHHGLRIHTTEVRIVLFAFVECYGNRGVVHAFQIERNANTIRRTGLREVVEFVHQLRTLIVRRETRHPSPVILCNVDD